MGGSPADLGKKLIEAARHWAGGGRTFAPDESIAQALEQIGAPAHVIQQTREQAGADDFEVLPENWETVQIFLHLSTSWSTVSLGMGAACRFGIPATEIESTLRMWGVRGRKQRKLLLDIRMMEQAALEVIADSLDQ